MALWRVNCWINLISICDRQTDSADKEKEIDAEHLNFPSHVIPHRCYRKEQRSYGTVRKHAFLTHLTLFCLAHSSLLYVPSAFICVICAILLYTYLHVAL